VRTGPVSAFAEFRAAAKREASAREAEKDSSLETDVPKSASTSTRIPVHIPTLPTLATSGLQHEVKIEAVGNDLSGSASASTSVSGTPAPQTTIVAPADRGIPMDVDKA
jgi:hypothetical protein